MTTQNDLIRSIIEKKLQESMQQSQMNQNPLDRINSISSNVENFGEGLSNTGKFLNNNFSSMNKIGTGMQNVGTALQNGAITVQKAVPTSSKLMSTVGSKLGSAIGTNAILTGATGATAAGTAGASAGATSGAAAGGSATVGAAAAGPIGALIALGVMALQGTNRKRAKQSGEQSFQLAQEQNNISKDRLAQSQQISEQIGNQEIQPQYDTNSLIDDYIYSQMPDTPIQNAITDYLKNPQQSDETEVKRGFFDKLADGLGDFVNGYQDNREKGFNPNNIRPDSSKGFMQRLGEGIGTTARIAQHPITQGLVAGGLSTALTGNPLYGLGMANKFANNKMNSNMYNQILQNQGLNVGNSNGIITSDDLSKILTARKYQKDFMTRKDYDRMRLENGLISVDEYNSTLSDPNYNPDEMLNINGLNSVSKSGRYAQENKNDKSKNFYRAKNDGKNVIKVEYGEKPDSHNYTHVTYGAKPEQKSTVKVNYGEKPKSNNNSTPRIKVKSPDGKVGSIPASQLADAIKKGYKKL